MNAEIISIGTEILLGHIVNTNASYLSQKLAEIGIDVFHHTTVGDNPARLRESIKKVLGGADIVITTGGLGPTVDDITVDTLKKSIGLEGAKWIRNKVGTAPGLIIEYHKKIIISLPGPPRELEPMFEEYVVPYLKKKFKSGWTIKTRTVRTTGLAESQVNAKVKDLLKLKPPTTVGIYAHLGEVDLKIMAKARNKKDAKFEITKIERIIKSRLKDYIFGYDDETLEDAVAKILTQKRLTIAVAESCTGGLLSNRLTNISGSSKYFMMGVVAYSNDSKESMLGVRHETLERFGAASKEVAFEMAKGVKHYACVDMGIGITGIAGPTGGSKRKPVGLAYIALVTDKKRLVREFRFKGSREEIKFQASQVALDLIRRNI